MRIEVNEVPMGPVHVYKDRSKNVMVTEVPFSPRLDVRVDGQFVLGTINRREVDALIAQAKEQDHADALAEDVLWDHAAAGVQAQVVPPGGPVENLGLPSGSNMKGGGR